MCDLRLCAICGFKLVAVLCLSSFLFAAKILLLLQRNIYMFIGLKTFVYISDVKDLPNFILSPRAAKKISIWSLLKT